MVELTINGKPIAVEDGTTILKAAKANGIKIPNLCFDKRLRPYGGCRLCVVEVEGVPRLFAACSTPVSPGMKVLTDTPKLKKARQTVLELLLVHHPLDCPVCDKAGECDLQDLAYEYGKPEGRFMRWRKDRPADVRGPLIELNSNRCILCGKCVRVCSEHQGRGALGFMGRGFPTTVTPAFGEILECDYCGQCVDACPTGALVTKPYKYKARAWFLEEKDSVCSFCGCGCTLTLGMREGKILRARGEDGKGVSDGNLCGRGRFGFDYIYDEARVRSPMIRKDGELVAVSWEDALKYVGDRLREIMRSDKGAGAVGAIGSPRCTVEDNFMLQKFMRDVVGSGNLDTSAALGYDRVQAAWEKSFGSTAPHRIRLDSPLGKDVVFVVDSDISVSHPIYGLNILQAKRDGAALIVSDFRETKLTRHSTQWLRNRPGSGVALLNGIAKIILDEGLRDRAAAAKQKGFAEWERGLAAYGADKVSVLTGVGPEALADAARTLARASAPLVTLSLGPGEHVKGSDLVNAAANLVILLGKGPETLQIPAEYANTFGAWWAGVQPTRGPGGKLVGGEPGKGLMEMLYEKKAVEGLLVMGADPVAAFPGSPTIVETLKSLDLLVVSTTMMNETAKLAHAVLPASSWSEKDGSFMNAEGLSQQMARVAEPTGQSIPDWQILRNLSWAMDREIKVRSIEDLREELAAVAGDSSELAVVPGFVPVAQQELSGITSKDRPLTLAARDVLQHSGTMSAQSEALNLVVSEAILDIHEDDAAKSGIKTNDHVRVASAHGTVYLKARVTDEVMPGVVCAPIHFSHGRVNALVVAGTNGAGRPEAVRVELAK